MKRTALCLFSASLALFGAAHLVAQDAPAPLRRAFPTPTPSPAPTQPPSPQQSPPPPPTQTPPPTASEATPMATPEARRQPSAFPRITPSGAAETRPHQERPREEARAERAAKREKPPREKRERRPFFRRVPGREPVDRPASRPTFDVGRSNWRVNSTIRGLEARWQDAVKAKDADALEKLLADDFVGTSIRGRRISKLGMLRTLRNDTNTYRSARVQKMKVRIIRPGTAVVTGIVTESGRKKNGQRFSSARRFTDTWKLEDGKWQCVSSEAAELQ